MKQKYFFIPPVFFLLIIVAGGCTTTMTPEMSGIVEKYQKKEYAALNEDFSKYMGMTQEQIRVILLDPKKTNPNDQTGIDDWTYYLKKPEILDTDYGLWNNTKKKIKYYLLVIRFQNGIVIGSKTGSPEIWVEQKGVVRALVDPPWKLLFSAAMFAL